MTLDVERLALAVHGDPAMGCPPGDDCMSPSRHMGFAERLAAEYARLEVLDFLGSVEGRPDLDVVALVDGEW